MLLPALTSPLVPALRYPTEPGGLTLSQIALSILRKPGLESHALISGVGWVNGLSLTNTIMEDGTQAASVDNPMGYMGDAAQTTLGPNLAVNSTFDDASWWSDTTSAIYGGKCNLITAGTYVGITKSSALTVGKTYYVEADVVVNSGPNSVYFGSTAEGVTRASTGKLAGYFTATATTLEIKRSGGGVALNATVDNISVKELVGAIPARQATTANKPILRRGHVNRIRNSTMQGAVAGSPGTLPTNWNVNTAAGLTTSVVGTGTEDGLPYIDLRFQGTSSGTTYNFHFDSSSTGGGATSPGVTWDASCYVKLVGGSLSNVSGVVVAPRFGLNNGTIVASVTAPLTTPNGTLRRIDVSTVASATSERVTSRFNIVMTSGAAIDVTLRIAAPQLESGSVANTFVPTTTAAASASSGPYWAEFDGTDFLSLAAPAFQQANDQIVIVAAACFSYAAQRVVMAPSCSASTFSKNAAIIFGTDGAPRARWTSNTPTDFTVTSSAAIPAGQVAVLTARKVGTTGSLRVNGVAQGTPITISGTITADSGGIGAERTSNPAGQFIGSIFSGIAINDTANPLTAAELATLERYVAQGAQLTL